MKLTKENKLLLQEEGYSQLREIEGRGICGLRSMVFTVGLFYGLDQLGYSGRYCYPNIAEAVVSCLTWDGKGDPKGNWIKHKGRVEYTNPNFDYSK